MHRHKLDPISLFFGLVFIGVAAWVVAADSPLWSFQVRWLWPAALLAVGTLLFGSVAAGAVRSRRLDRQDD